MHLAETTKERLSRATKMYPSLLPENAAFLKWRGGGGLNYDARYPPQLSGTILVSSRK